MVSMYACNKAAKFPKLFSVPYLQKSDPRAFSAHNVVQHAWASPDPHTSRGINAKQRQATFGRCTTTSQGVRAGWNNPLSPATR